METQPPFLCAVVLLFAVSEDKSGGMEIYMRKLIIVDDEIRQCRGLKNILNREYENLDIHIFTSAREALSYIETDQPEIVITDICMPDMNGLEMTEAIKNIDKRMIVILLTGYAEFEYAQKAISIGAFEYLVKPLNPDKLKEVLEKANDELEKEKVLNVQHEKMQQQLDMALPIYMEKLLNQWVYGWSTAHEKKEVEKIIPAGKDGFVIATYLPELTDKLAKLDKTDEEELKSQIKWWIKRLIKRPWHCLSFYSNVIKDVMITIVLLQSDIDISRLEKKDSLSRMMRSLEVNALRSFPEMETGLEDYQMVIGELRCDLLHSIENCYQNAVQVLPYFFYFPNNHVLYSHYINAHQVEQVRIGLAEEEALREVVREGNGDAAKEIFEKIWDRCCASGYLEPVQLKNVFENLINHISRALCLGDIFSYTIREKDSWEEFTEQMETFLEKLVQKNYVGEKRNKVIAAEIEKYLEEHFKEDVTLENLSVYFGLAPAYCSRLIKEATGDNFSKLLLKKRIKKTKELLEQTDLHIYEIAELTGYTDVKYFNRVFKKETGVTPIQYRKALEKFGGGWKHE